MFVLREIDSCRHGYTYFTCRSMNRTSPNALMYIYTDEHTLIILILVCRAFLHYSIIVLLYACNVLKQDSQCTEDQEPTIFRQNEPHFLQEKRWENEFKLLKMFMNVEDALLCRMMCMGSAIVMTCFNPGQLQLVYLHPQTEYRGRNSWSGLPVAVHNMHRLIQTLLGMVQLKIHSTDVLFISSTIILIHLHDIHVLFCTEHAFIFRWEHILFFKQQKVYQLIQGGTEFINSIVSVRNY